MSEDSTFNIEDFLSSAKEAKAGIYSDGPEVTPQQLANEIKAAKAEFSEVIKEEFKRIKVFVDQENDRILELRGQSEAPETCPICLEVIPAIFMEGEEVGDLACCGVSCHQKCFATWDIRRRTDPTISSACFHCRSNGHSDTSERGLTNHWEKLILTGSTVSKGKALKEFGVVYENGQSGKERNLKKALEYYEKAAEMGNSDAQAVIADIFHYGEFHELPIPKCSQKAMDMAKRAVDQGHPRAQARLGICLNQQHDSGKGASTEQADRLFALSAYQGDVCGIRQREQFYAKQFENLKQCKRAGSSQYMREIVILRLYWSGRLCNKERNELSRNELNFHKVNFVVVFQAMMKKIWHRRPCLELDPLTGYSHIPFLTSIYSVLRKEWHDHEYTNAGAHGDMLKIIIWKQICANCGRQRDKECILKQCARCQVFSYCSKKCQVQHWKAGHKVDCKGRHWIESYFPNIRKR